MLRFYDLQFNLLGETNNYTSLQFNRSWYGCGDIELHINRYTLLNNDPAVYLWYYVLETINTPTKELIIMLDNNPKKAAIINFDGCNFNQSGKASEDLVLKGKELKWLAHRALVYPTSGNLYELTDNVETVVKTLINLNQGAGAAANRQLSALAIEADGSGGNSIYYSATNYPFLDAELEKIATTNDCGWWYEFDPSTSAITACFSLGRDCTRDNGTLPPVIFDQFAGLAEGEYSHNDNQYYNVVVAKGKPYDDTVTSLVKSYPTTSIPTGFRRREIYKEFDAIITTGGTPFVNLDSAVAQYLEGANQELYLNGKALQTGAMVYEVDYDLGDLVALQAFDLTQDKRITNIKETYEADNTRKIDLTFAQDLPELPKVISKQIGDIKRIV